MSDTGNTAVDDLQFGSHDAVPHNYDWTERVIGEDWSYTEAFTYTDDNGRDWTLVVQAGSIAAVWIDGRVYESYEFDEYAANTESEEDDSRLTEDEFDALFDVESDAPNFPEGPMMSYWYDCPAVEDNPKDAAVRLIDLPLCVVEVDGEWGLALTGGGMDLTWEIVAAYVALGQLPPVRYARDLPGMAGRGASDEDRILIAACLRVLRSAEDRAKSDRERLEERATRWAG